jgi:hypothetical protein
VEEPEAGAKRKRSQDENVQSPYEYKSRQQEEAQRAQRSQHEPAQRAEQGAAQHAQRGPAQQARLRGEDAAQLDVAASGRRATSQELADAGRDFRGDEVANGRRLRKWKGSQQGWTAEGSPDDLGEKGGKKRRVLIAQTGDRVEKVLHFTISVYRELTSSPRPV